MDRFLKPLASCTVALSKLWTICLHSISKLPIRRRRTARSSSFAIPKPISASRRVVLTTTTKFLTTFAMWPMAWAPCVPARRVCHVWRSINGLSSLRTACCGYRPALIPVITSARRHSRSAPSAHRHATTKSAAAATSPSNMALRTW